MGTVTLAQPATAAPSTPVVAALCAAEILGLAGFSIVPALLPQFIEAWLLVLMTLDVSAMTGPKWAQRFIIAVDPVVEDSSFLFYGPRFASLLGLPATPYHFHLDSHPAADAIHPGVHERLYYLDALQLSRPDAGRG
jgi:hypothetical protein